MGWLIPDDLPEWAFLMLVVPHTLVTFILGGCALAMWSALRYDGTLIEWRIT